MADTGLTADLIARGRFLSKAQRHLMGKAEGGAVAPYGAQWTTFYKLRALGFMAYVPGSSCTRIELTDAGLRAITASQTEKE